jgi:hypothetical protein
MKKTKLDMSAALDSYTQQVAGTQEWFAKWEATRPQGQWGRWHISDRD